MMGNLIYYVRLFLEAVVGVLAGREWQGHDGDTLRRNAVAVVVEGQ